MPNRTAQPTEHDIQVAIFDYARIMANQDPRWNLLVAIPNAGGYVGGFRSNVARVRSMVREGVKKGFPDIFLFWPCGEYHGLAIEIKRDRTCQLSPEQRAWISTLKDAGYCAMPCYGFDEAKAAIETYLRLEGR